MIGNKNILLLKFMDSRIQQVSISWPNLTFTVLCQTTWRDLMKSLKKITEINLFMQYCLLTLSSVSYYIWSFYGGKWRYQNFHVKYSWLHRILMTNACSFLRQFKRKHQRGILFTFSVWLKVNNISNFIWKF
jgi:hypothetical protein